MQTTTPSWPSRDKIVFRFLFILLAGSSILCWDNFTDMVSRYLKFRYDYGAAYKFLVKPFYWLDRHIYHSGYDPKFHISFPGDNHFGLLFYLSLLSAAVIGALSWSLLDRKRPNYNRLLYWFRVYIRYILAMTMFFYGMDKLMPVQMTYPNVEALLTPMGEYRRFGILWNFFGASPGYMMMTGACEILGGLMLFNKRMVVPGCLLLLAILINVVSLNIFYNIPVKMFSSQLLIYTLFLLFPYSYQLVQFFFFGQAVVITSPHYGFHSKRKKNILKIALIAFPLLLLALIGLGISERYQRNTGNARRQRIYEVTQFVSKDTLPPLLTDSTRWKRLLFAYSNYSASNYAVICNMRDEKTYYSCEVDSNNKTFTFRDSPDSLQWNIFHYMNPEKDQLLLSGKWKGQDLRIRMKSIPIDSMQLNKEKIKWVED